MSRFEFSNSDTAGIPLSVEGAPLGPVENMGSRSLTLVAAGVRRGARCLTEWEPSSCVEGIDPVNGDRLRRLAVPTAEYREVTA